jgi:hypothetical protein
MKSKPICGARTRKGAPCQSKLLLAGRKCKFHGGKSTGPRTPEGRAKAIAAMLAGRFSEEGRQAHGALMRALWQDPHFRLRVARKKAARTAMRDHAFVAQARWLGLAELDARAAWAAARRAKRAEKIRALEAQVLMMRVARDLGVARPR